MRPPVGLTGGRFTLVLGSEWSVEVGFGGAWQRARCHHAKMPCSAVTYSTGGLRIKVSRKEKR